MTKSHYDILGLDCNATPEQIKAAYRREAKRLHPDHYDGEEGSAPFRAARAAYEVLGDPQQRCAYDRELSQARKPQTTLSPHSGVRRASRWHTPVEPLIPEGHPVPRAGTARSFDSRRVDQVSHVEALSPRTLHVNARLSPAQVRYGGEARLVLPVAARCPTCGGAGRGLFALCPECLGQGFIEERLVLNVTLPAGLQDGETLRISLAEVGLRDVVLAVHCTWT